MWVATAILSGLAPLLFVLAVPVDLARGRPALPSARVVFFALCFGWIECLGIGSLGCVGLFTLGRPAARLELTFAVQRLYTRLLLGSAALALNLEFQVEGDGLVDTGPWLVLVQHASIVDTLVPGVFLAARHHLKLRYVLKRELRYGPCLDIAGSWLPNHFVSRDGADSEREIAAVRALKAGLGPGEGVLVYPEGTRYSPAKLQRALPKVDPRFRPRAEKLGHLLPPRLGGTVALLTTAPACDVLVVGHHGLEGFASVRDIWAGKLIGTTVRIRFFKVAANPPPEDPAAFVYDAWEKLDAWLEELARAR